MLKLTRLRITELFGCLNHDVPLSLEGITFIHGPNGCGKTTVLKLLDGALACQFDALSGIEFNTMTLSFSDRSEVQIKRKTIPADTDFELERSSFTYQSEEVIHEVAFHFTQLINGKITQEQEVLLDTTDTDDIAEIIREKPGIVGKYLPHLMRVGTRLWRERDGKNNLTSRLIAEKFGNAFPFQFPNWYREKVSEIPRGYIQTQRLLKLLNDNAGDPFSENEATLKDVVDLLSEELKKDIALTISKSALNSQSRERSFPQRLLTENFQAKNESELRAQYTQLEKRLKDLAAVGLQENANNIALPAKKLNPTMRKVLALYLSDLNEKLDTFTVLQQRIELIKSLYGIKIRRKDFQITRDHGFSLKDKSTDKSMDAGDLSSGEQHQLVLLYRLIFSQTDRQLFLIDEPEISLHVEWQRMFLDDLLQISKLRGHVFLIATHSPQIINNRIDLAVALDGGIDL